MKRGANFRLTNVIFYKNDISSRPKLDDESYNTTCIFSRTAFRCKLMFEMVRWFDMV
jgi:hypothetical protein